jgi:hypothetical protein
VQSAEGADGFFDERGGVILPADIGLHEHGASTSRSDLPNDLLATDNATVRWRFLWSTLRLASRDTLRKESRAMTRASLVRHSFPVEGLHIYSLCKSQRTSVRFFPFRERTRNCMVSMTFVSRLPFHSRTKLGFI